MRRIAWQWFGIPSEDVAVEDIIRALYLEAVLRKTEIGDG